MKTLLTALILVGVLAPAAWADGLPVVGVEAKPSGVTAPKQDVRYVALRAGPNTVVHRVHRDGARILGSRMVRGTFELPVVAYDGTAAGLSADGRSLVLIRPRKAFPRAKTSFAVLDTAGLTLRRTLTLPGDYSFDALSPDARWMYLIQYTAAKDPLQYRVRALDLLSGKLDPKRIVDPREPDEAMNGRPLTRATSPDGRWAYTLYDGTEHPFVHALDTVARDARCIDLHWLTGRKDLGSLRFGLASDGRELSVRARGKAVAIVDTRTFEASPSADARGRSLWIVGSAAALLLGAAGVYVVRSRRRAASTSFGGATSA